MLGGIHVKATLFVFRLRHRKLLMESRVQLGQAHADLNGTGAVITNNPALTSQTGGDARIVRSPKWLTSIREIMQEIIAGGLPQLLPTHVNVVPLQSHSQRVLSLIA